MQALTRILEAAVAEGRMPGVVAMAADRSGLIHQSAHGRRDASAPMAVDSVFRLFSMTKAVASVAAMRLVEEGLLDLDGPVGDILPELDRLPVLVGFSADDAPALRPAKGRATVRQLLTHTAGPVYEMWSADQRKYLKDKGLPGMGSGARDAFGAYPLAFDPGTRFGYGVSTDWLGRVIDASGAPLEGAPLDVGREKAPLRRAAPRAAARGVGCSFGCGDVRWWWIWRI